MRRLRPLVHACGLVAALGQTAIVFGAAAAPNVQPFNVPISANTRLLVVAPHPDDEALAAAGLIRRVVSAGGQVRVVVVTSGDAFVDGVELEDRTVRPTPFDFREYGQIREGESREAMTSLGVRPEQTFFLGYPDDGVCLLASRYLTAKRPMESPYTDRVEPPASEQIIRGVRYRGVDLRRELERLIADFSPTLIVAPHPEDDHPDHCATYIFLAEAFRALESRGGPRPPALVLHFLVHDARWPPASATFDSPLEPPGDFPSKEGRWLRFALSPAEIAAKAKAVHTYRTQKRVIGPFLEKFIRQNELFIEGRPELPECWCNATTVATEVPVEQRRRARPAR